MAHAIGYTLVGVLPQTGIGILGIGAADQAALTRFTAEFDFPRSYVDAVLRLISCNFGRTLDQVPVTDALLVSILQSLPIFLISTAVLVASTAATLLGPSPFFKIAPNGALEFLTFIPAFLPGFLILAVAIMTAATALLEDTPYRTLVLGLCIGVTPSCLSIVTIRNGYDIELSQRYVLVMRAYGYDRSRLYAGVRKAVLLSWIPTWEKLLTLQLAILIFTEAVFSYPGFGSLILLAVQRTDVNVILASIVTLSVSVVAVRLLGNGLLAMLEPRDRDVLES